MRLAEASAALVRICVGIVFAGAGALKIGHFDALAAAISGFRVLPGPLIGPLAILLPFLEAGIGLYLIVGLFTRAAAIVGAMQSVLYASAIASAVIRHLPANCGCFGPQDRAVADWPHALADLALAAACMLVALRGPGALSLDARLRSRT